MILLAAGGLITFALAAAHYLSPVSRRLAANSDEELVLLSKDHPVLFVYHAFSQTVNAVQLPAKAARVGSAYQRACEVLKTFSGNSALPQEGPAYIEAQAPDMDAFEDLINNWRARPARLNRLVRYLRELKSNDATNLSIHEMAILVPELLRMNSSGFIKEDFDKTRTCDPLPPGDPATAGLAARIEVLNASGRKDLAVLVTKYLRKKGFDVINFGTYGSVEGITKIVNCSDNIEAARGIRDALGLGGLEIHSKFDKLAIAQARIILGVDFDGAKIEKIERGIK